MYATIAIAFLLVSAKLPAQTPPIYQTQTIEGWTVNVNETLQKEKPDATKKALEILTAQLKEIEKIVPKPAVVRLKEVKLFLNPGYPGIRGTAEYHEGRKWLVDNHRDPDMAKSVEFTDIPNFEAEWNRMPNFVLHELAHSFHDRVLGFDNKEIKAAYDKAKVSGTYDKVERWRGNGKPNTFERAYAMNNPQEYFAETTEAFFGRNDFFPFVREELEKHDPEMAGLLKRLWGVK